MPGVSLSHYDEDSEASRYATIKWKRYFLYHLYPFCVLVFRYERPQKVTSGNFGFSSLHEVRAGRRFCRAWTFNQRVRSQRDCNVTLR